jgi:hypothetical protein
MAEPPQDTATAKGTPALDEARAKPSPRDARLKAALQLNIARRKAQARALPAEALRGAGDTGPDAAPGRSEPDEAPRHFPQDHPGAPAPYDPSEKD